MSDNNELENLLASAVAAEEALRADYKALYLKAETARKKAEALNLRWNKAASLSVESRWADNPEALFTRVAEVYKERNVLSSDRDAARQQVAELAAGLPTCKLCGAMGIVLGRTGPSFEGG